MPQVPTLLTPPEVAERLGVADETVRQWCKAGRIPALRLPSGRFKIRSEVVDAIERGEGLGGAA
jgi:excisionase family DNA binding protein